MKPKYPRIEHRKLSELSPHKSNPRKISAENQSKLKRSLEELGNLSPVTFNVRTKKVIGGHQRLDILKELGETFADVWCVDLSPAKEKAALLALNTSSGEWDEEKLSEVLKDLEGTEFDAEFFDLGDAFSEPVEIRPMEIKAPPRFAWCLIGIPITQFGKVQQMIDQLPQSAIIKISQNDGPKNG